MRRPSHECHHKFKRINRDVEKCVKCKTEQLIIALDVESVSRQKKTLAPNKIVPMLHG